MAIRSTVRVLGVLVHRRTLRRHDQWTLEQLRAHQDREWVTNHQGNRLTFYGGRITVEVVGPFKGRPGSRGW
jgi:hypothetical protein